MTDEKRPTCFIAMPITTHQNEAERYRDPEHWHHVMEHLFVPAIEAAGYRPIRPVTQGSDMIHGQIVKHLSEADMVLCDFSGLNANVFFELGVRTSLNLPVALVRDEHTTIPFDLGGMNSHKYTSKIEPWTLEPETSGLTKHVKDCVISCNGKNPLWQRFGLAIKAEEPTTIESPLEAKIDLILERTEANRRRTEFESAYALNSFEVPGMRNYESSAARFRNLERSIVAIFEAELDGVRPEFYQANDGLWVVGEPHTFSQVLRQRVGEKGNKYGVPVHFGIP